jgi:hypothetical protein
VAYHPSTLLKIYLYGYLNRVQSSQRLEREPSLSTGAIAWGAARRSRRASNRGLTPVSAIGRVAMVGRGDQADIRPASRIKGIEIRSGA